MPRSEAACAARRAGRTGSELKIEVGGSIRYPDAFVICTPVAPKDTIVRDPTVVFEILSESTASTDLIEKNAEYRATASIQRYIILEQTHAAAIVFARKGEDWVADIVAGGEAVLRMPEIGIEFRLPNCTRGRWFVRALMRRIGTRTWVGRLPLSSSCPRMRVSTSSFGRR